MHSEMTKSDSMERRSDTYRESKSQQTKDNNFKCP